MTIFETLGFMLVLFSALIGFSALVYCAYRGAAQLSKELRLGQSCIEVSDEVVSEISVPVLRPQAVRS